MMDKEDQARKFFAEAERKASIVGKFQKLITGSNQDITAYELFVKAGNLFKICKKWQDAGKSFVRAAEVFPGKEAVVKASNYAEAGNCYRKLNNQSAIDCMILACKIYQNAGMYAILAKHYKTIGELYEADKNYEPAMDYYQKATDSYTDLQNKSHARSCELKVAELAATYEQYERATTIYQKIATQSIDSRLLKYSAPEHYFRSLLCLLCVDLINVQIAHKRYLEEYPSFADSRQSKLIEDLILALEEQDQSMFNERIANYNQITRLDEWQRLLLNRARTKCIQDVDSDMR